MVENVCLILKTNLTHVHAHQIIKAKIVNVSTSFSVHNLNCYLI